MNNQQRAADFLKAWQDAMTKQLKDGDALKAMLAAMQGFGGAHDAAPRPAAAAAADDDAIRHVTQRLGKLERELAKLAAQLHALAAKTKKPARAGRGSSAKPVAKRQRAVSRAKPTVARPAKPRAKAKQSPKRKR